VLDAADRLEAGLRSIRSGVSHRLAIAASQTVAEHLVPHWLVELRGIEQASGEQAPGHTPTVVELTVANSARVIELVRDVKVRLGFIETPHLPADLVTAHLRDDEMLVVTAPGHPWARRRRPLSLAEVAATPMVMREAGSGTRVTLTDHLAAQHPPLSAQIAMELGTSAAVRSAIAEGVGPGVSAGWPSATTSCSAGWSPSRSGAAADKAADGRLAARPRPAAARGRAPPRGREGRRAGPQMDRRGSRPGPICPLVMASVSRPDITPAEEQHSADRQHGEREGSVPVLHRTLPTRPEHVILLSHVAKGCCRGRRGRRRT
jgi:DNA-binding transcriptional LysR family regulator